MQVVTASLLQSRKTAVRNPLSKKIVYGQIAHKLTVHREDNKFYSVLTSDIPKAYSVSSHLLIVHWIMNSGSLETVCR